MILAPAPVWGRIVSGCCFKTWAVKQRLGFRRGADRGLWPACVPVLVL